MKEVQIGAHDFENNKVTLFARKTGKINTSMFAAPKLAFVPASLFYCDVNWSYHNVCAKFHKDLRGLDGALDLKYNKVPRLAKKNREYQYFDVCCPGTSSCANKPFLLRCNLVIPQCICQVSLGLKEI